MSKQRLHSGRLLVYYHEDEWWADLRPKKEKTTIRLVAVNADAAVLEAEQLYADLRAVTNPKPECWQCIHWKPSKAECSLGFPEGKKSGGRFARQCSSYWPD